MPSTLTVSTISKHKPEYSSGLTKPISPHSPLSPVSPKLPRPVHRPALLNSTRRCSSVFLSHPKPTSPLPWRWQCHVCARCYDLGTTRRCLDDGHFFCSDNHDVSSTKRTRGKDRKARRSHRACTSEFDYKGWETWGVWRKAIEASTSNGSLSPPASAGLTADDKPISKKQKTHRHCHSRCNYPSECRRRNSVNAPDEVEEEDITPIVEDDDDEKALDELLAAQSARDDGRDARAEADKQAAGAPHKAPTSFEEILGLAAPENCHNTSKQVILEDLEDSDGDHGQYGQPFDDIDYRDREEDLDEAAEDFDDDEDADADAEEEGDWDADTLYHADGQYDDDDDDEASEGDTEADWSTISSSSTIANAEEVPNTSLTPSNHTNKSSVSTESSYTTHAAVASTRSQASPQRARNLNAKAQAKQERKRELAQRRSAQSGGSRPRLVRPKKAKLARREKEVGVQEDNPLCYSRPLEELED